MARPTRQTLLRKLAALYRRMQAAYDEAAGALGLSCEGCADNCCTSFFQHHTYIEWLYLWQGMKALPEPTRQAYLERAESAVRQAQAALTRGERPAVMCPVNDDGLCGLYEHRLMICRLHGVPNELTVPGRGAQRFPGCWRAQELVDGGARAAVLDRTALYRELAGLEMALLGKKAKALPRVDLTLAQMLVMGPPEL